MRDLLRSNDILTLGTSSKDVDWEALWRTVLNADDSYSAAEQEREEFIAALPTVPDSRLLYTCESSLCRSDTGHLDAEQLDRHASVPCSSALDNA